MMTRTEALNTLEVGSLSDLHSFERHLRSFVLPHQVPALRFELGALSASRNAALSAVMNRYRTECGCLHGGVAMSCFIVVTAGLAALTDGGHHLNHWSVGTLCGTALGASLLGKGTGLVWARLKMIQLARRTARRIRAPQLSGQIPLTLT